MRRGLKRTIPVTRQLHATYARPVMERLRARSRQERNEAITCGRASRDWLPIRPFTAQQTPQPSPIPSSPTKPHNSDPMRGAARSTRFTNRTVDPTIYLEHCPLSSRRGYTRPAQRNASFAREYKTRRRGFTRILPPPPSPAPLGFSRLPRQGSHSTSSFRSRREPQRIRGRALTVILVTIEY